MKSIGDDSPWKPGRERVLLAGRHGLAGELASALREPCGFPGGRLLLAVSGGPDSLALLWLAAAIADRLSADTPLEPIVAHIDHGLRAESADEAAFVEQQAAEAGLRCLAVRVDCTGPGNVSDRARRARYEALERLAVDEACDAIATAHHAEDRFESILIAIGRGRGLESLRAMPARRSLASGTPLIRPLLGVSKASLEAFCRDLSLAPRHDPSNADPRRLRARLREAVLPELEAILPGASLRAGSVADEADLAAAAIERWLDETFGPAEQVRWPRTAIAALPESLRLAGLLRALHTLEPASARDTPRRIVLSIAKAIADDDRSPRRWAVGAALEVEVTSREIAVQPRQEAGDRHGARHAST